MEFKGTKGKWVLRIFIEGQMSVRNEDDTRKICVSRVNNQAESTHNLLLISKAPEMLEMLQSISATLEAMRYEDDSNDIFDLVDAEKLDNLIKQATEI